MVSLKSFLTTSVVLIAAFVNVEAAVSPTYPSPGTIQTEGTSYDITWTFDGKNPSTTYRIDFMTGSNDAQTVLTNVATGIAANSLKYSFVAPQVTPNAAIYFFMFTGSDGVSSWTTRFGIVGADGKLAKESNQVQPNGDKIPWGTGKLLSAVASSNSSSAAVSSAAPAASSAVVSAASSAVAAASSAPAVSVAVASTTASVVPAASSAVPTVAQVAAAGSAKSSGSLVKPALTFVSAAVAGYFAL